MICLFVSWSYRFMIIKKWEAGVTVSCVRSYHKGHGPGHTALTQGTTLRRRTQGSRASTTPSSRLPVCWPFIEDSMRLRPGPYGWPRWCHGPLLWRELGTMIRLLLEQRKNEPHCRQSFSVKYFLHSQMDTSDLHARASMKHTWRICGAHVSVHCEAWHSTKCFFVETTCFWWLCIPNGVGWLQWAGFFWFKEPYTR